MKVMLKNVRLSFPDLFEAVEFKTGDGKPRFNATFLIERGSENDKKIEAAIVEAAKEQFGAKYEKLVAGMRGNVHKFCYLDGDLKECDGYEGMNYLAAHSKIRPKVLDADKTPLTAQDGKPYAGCYVNGVIRVWAQDNKFGKRINASLEAIQFVKDGEPLGAPPVDLSVLPDVDEPEEDGDL